MKELNTIQVRLNAPKNQYNSFGKYHYRSCEDILEAVKPLLAETECSLTINDKVVLIGERYYIEATATLTNSKGESVSNCGWAREPEERKGQDDSQITGATSSYARKYALNGLFCIDDNKDPDATNEHGRGGETPSKPTTKPTDKPAKTTSPDAENKQVEDIKALVASTKRCATPEAVVNIIQECKSSAALVAVWNEAKKNYQNNESVRAAVAASPYNPNKK